MKTTSNENYQVIEQKACSTKDWNAWINMFPPAPAVLHVHGQVEVPNPGVEALLRKRVPQGINPKVLLLDLILVQRPGIWPEIITLVPAQYHELVDGAQYDQVQIFCDNQSIETIDVQIIA